MFGCVEFLHNCSCKHIVKIPTPFAKMIQERYPTPTKLSQNQQGNITKCHHLKMKLKQSIKL